MISVYFIREIIYHIIRRIFKYLRETYDKKYAPPIPLIYLYVWFFFYIT